MGELIRVPINKWYEKRDREQFELARAELTLKRLLAEFEKGFITESQYTKKVDAVCLAFGLVNLDTPA